MSIYPTIWFLRHGQTHWNAERRIQGQLESPLTEQGLADAGQQAKLLPPILAGDPDVYVSPLGRARQTADIALSGKEYRIDARLAEAHAGDWQGLLHADVRRDNPDLIHPDTTALELFLAAPGGEGYDALHGRITGFLDDLTRPSVVIAHGLLGQVMRGILNGTGRTQMGQMTNKQGCIYLLENGTEKILQL